MATRRWSSKTMRIRSGLFCGSICWVLLVSGLVSVPKPLSQIQRSTRWLLQGLSPRPSFGGFGFSLNHNLVVEAIRAADVSDQVRGVISQHRPKAILIYRDFPSTSNAIVQVAQANYIPVYTTQHSVTPEFTGKNYRAGNLEIENSFSETLVCWGEFTRSQRARYLEKEGRSTRLLVYCRPTSPEERQLSIDKSSLEKIKIDELIVSLMGLRHEEDNAALLRLVFEFASDKPCQVKIRPHPALSNEKYLAYIDHLKETCRVDAVLTDSRATVQSSYTERSLGITGLTSTYYDNLLFGIPVVFFDYNIQLVEALPRVLPGVTSSEELLQQVNLIESLTWSDWYQRADAVCKSVYGRKCMDFESPQSMLDFVRADAEERLPRR